MREFLLISTGAVAGANLRYWVVNFFASRLGAAFPYGTLVVNITGSFLIGFVLTLAAQRLVSDVELRLLAATGFLGAYTTFSTFSFDTLSLVEQGEVVRALLNAAGNLVGALAAVYIGVVLARAIG